MTTQQAKCKRRNLLIATLGLFTASVFTHLYVTQSKDDIEQIRLYSLQNGTYIPSCKAAYINGAIITASHCYGNDKEPSQLFIKKQDHYEPLEAPHYRGEYNGFKGVDIATIGNINADSIGDCDEVAYSIDSNTSCKLSLFKSKTSNKRISTNCFMERGESGTVLVNEQGKACLVYSGFYDIIDNNKIDNLKIGVFTPIKEIKNEQLTRNKTE